MASVVKSEYGAIPQQEDNVTKEEQQQAVVAKAVAVAVEHDVSNNSNSIIIPEEARHLTWNDTYYTDNQIDGVIAVFDVDYDKIRRSMWCVSLIMLPLFVFYMIFIFTLQDNNDSSDDNFFAYFWLMYSVFITVSLVTQVKKISKGVLGLHVAVTKDGIRKDMHKYPFGNMFRTTTIIPYNEIKAIKAQRRCGCCNTTGNVLIQSSEDDTWNVIQGLTDNSEAFISLVNAMIARNATVINIEDVENQTSLKVV